MRLCVVFISKGHIVAASRLDVQSRVPLPRPVATGKFKSIDLDVPTEHSEKDLETICQNLRVDAKRKQLVAVSPRKSTGMKKTRPRSS